VSQPEIACLDAALKYATNGWSVIPVHSIRHGACTCGRAECESPGKHPVGRWKHRQTVKATLSELSEQWSRTPWANVGIVTGQISGLLVLDIDDADAIKEGSPLSAAMIGGAKTPIALTGRTGGRHVYLRHPGGSVGNFAGKIPGIDGRGDGGFVVAPPSAHASGRIYSWAGNGYDQGADPADAPDAILALFESGAPPSASSSPSVLPTAYATKAMADELHRVRSASEGTRNSALNAAAFNLGQLCASGQLDRHVVEMELWAAGAQAGLSDAEVRATVQNGLQGGTSKPRAEPPPKLTTATAHVGDYQPLDMSILSGTRRPPPIFPSNHLGPVWARWIAQSAAGCSAPPDYVAGALMVVASSLIGNARRVSPWREWVEPAHLWGMIVGDPSAGKTPGAKAVLRLISPLEDELVRQHAAQLDEHHAKVAVAERAEAEWKKSCKQAEKTGEATPDRPVEANAPREPACPQLQVNDATPEKLGVICQDNPKGVLFFRDELAGWLYGFGRYGGDGERQLWLEAYNGDQRRIDRVKHPVPIFIRHFSVAVFGGMQPERLSEAIIKEVDDGLGARFLYFWPNAVPPRRPTSSEDGSFAGFAFRRLSGLSMPKDERGVMQPEIRTLASQAADVFERWRQVHARDAQSGLMLKGHYGKMPGLVLRLALIIEYLRWAANDRGGDPEESALAFGDIDCIEKQSVEAAIELIESYFKPMAQRVFGDAEMPVGDRDAVRLAEWLVKVRPETFNARQVRNTAGGPGLRDPKRMEAACEALQDRGWLRFAGTRADNRPGRQTVDWEVNPLIFAAW
jgi:hypothetical protein